MRDQEKLAVANSVTPFKIRIHAQAFVLVRRAKPKYEAQRTESGLLVQVENWYDEHALGEFAVNHNDREVHHKTLKEMLGNLGSSIMKSMQSKGLIRW